MKNVMAIAFAVFTAVTANAQVSISTSELVKSSQDIATQIREEGPRLSADQKARLAKKLVEMKDILRGQVIPGRDRDRNELVYSCVDRDKDNQAPYVFSTRDGLQVTRIQDEKFNSMEECTQSLNSAIRTRLGTLVCVSRDKDARDPYVIGVLSGQGIKRFESTFSSSKQSCEQKLRSLSQSRGNLILCVSRDKDDRDPWVATSINAETGSAEVGSEKFSSFNECQTFLGR